MGLEFVGFRILTINFGGYIDYMSWIIILSVLLSISLGYYLGGELSKKKSSKKILYLILLTVLFYLLVMIHTYQSIANYADSFGMFYGPIITYLYLTFIPMFFLSMTSPYIIRLLSSVKSIGNVSGQVYGIGTLGNIIGIFATTFVLIPMTGIFSSMIFFSYLLIFICIFGLIKKHKYILLILLLLFHPLLHSDPVETNRIYETESPYNLIEIYDKGDYYQLDLNNHMQSVVYKHLLTDKKEIINKDIFSIMTIGGILVEPNETLILGGGGGAMALIFDKYFNSNIDIVEIDGKIIETGIEFFNISDHNRIQVFIDDARNYVSTTNKKYDLVVIDIFNKGGYTPFYLSTIEFYEDINNLLTEDGILIMNLFVPHKKEEMYGPYKNTLMSIFPSIFYIDYYDHNDVIIASKKSLTKKEIKMKIISTPYKELKNIVVYANKIEKISSEGNEIYTDDASKLEYYYLISAMN